MVIWNEQYLKTLKSILKMRNTISYLKLDCNINLAWKKASINVLKRDKYLGATPPSELMPGSSFIHFGYLVVIYFSSLFHMFQIVYMILKKSQDNAYHDGIKFTWMVLKTVVHFSQGWIILFTKFLDQEKVSIKFT